MNRFSIFLIGFMGAGKTTVGEALAARLKWKFIDLDQVIITQQQRSISEIFAQQGEAYFRGLERDALQHLDKRTNAIIALGGGAFNSPQNREIVRAQGISIFLNCSMAEILKRLGNDQSRPLFRDAEQMTALLESRLPIYQAADLEIEVTNRSVDEIVTEIISRLKLSPSR